MCHSFVYLQKGEDPGKFRQLDEILYVEGYPGYQHLLSLAEKSMEIVCQTQGKLLLYDFGKHSCAHLREPEFSDC